MKSPKTIPTKRSHHKKPLPPGTVIAADVAAINPDWFYRRSDGPKFFGLGEGAMAEAIAKKKIPAPIKAVEGGSAVGWFGSQILEWKRQRIETPNVKWSPPAKKAVR